MTLADLKITPAMPEVSAGPVVVHVTNSGSQVHNLSFPGLAKDSGDKGCSAWVTALIVEP